MSAIPLAFHGKLKNINIKLLAQCFYPSSGNACKIHEQQRPLHLKPLGQQSQALPLAKGSLLISITVVFSCWEVQLRERGRGETLPVYFEVMCNFTILPDSFSTLRYKNYSNTHFKITQNKQAQNNSKDVVLLHSLQHNLDPLCVVNSEAYHSLEFCFSTGWPCYFNNFSLFKDQIQNQNYLFLLVLKDIFWGVSGNQQ